MLARKGFFYLLCLAGYLVIIFKGIPVVFYNDIQHISLFPRGDGSDILHNHIDYRRLALYFFIWAALCFLVYKIIEGVNIRERIKVLLDQSKSGNNE